MLLSSHVYESKIQKKTKALDKQMQYAFVAEASMSEKNLICAYHYFSCSFVDAVDVCCRPFRWQDIVGKNSTQDLSYVTSDNMYDNCRA
ncbi:Hypothetical predicted protein [Scomber scombrus]|uniref:Uncharacterized protein n=1 Tax=Scomber scombrus TaxID=13677 RepID=A0AAV1N302_SCOSC